MAWGEWTELKAAAVRKGSTGTRLNQVEPATRSGNGVGTPVLKSDKAQWAKAAEGVGSLPGNIGGALTKLEESRNGLGKSGECLSVTAEHEIHESWSRYLKNASKRCGDLREVLAGAGHDLLRTDEAVKAEIDGLRGRYSDTPAVGDQDRGR
ncbi:hypothetical protein [Streptomyces sp. NPDC014744]|uniref:hypothetical protein n=1 Tax=Streptomyces sp. NPDC014744 TaxID=3364903 RepID=UPI0036F92AE4